MAKLTIGLSSNAPEQLNAVSDSDFPCQVTVTNLAGLVVFSNGIHLTENGSSRTITIADKNDFSRLVNDLHGIGQIHKKDVLACVEWQSAMDLVPEPVALEPLLEETNPADLEPTQEELPPVTKGKRGK